MDIACVENCGYFGFVQLLPSKRPLIGYYTGHQYVVTKSPEWNKGEFPGDDDIFNDTEILQESLNLSDKDEPAPVKKTLRFSFKIYFKRTKFKAGNPEKLEPFQLYSKTDKSMGQTSFIFKCQGDYYR